MVANYLAAGMVAVLTTTGALVWNGLGRSPERLDRAEATYIANMR
jgi:hypothetical protein